MGQRIGRDFEAERNGIERSMFIDLGEGRRIELSPREFVRLKQHMDSIVIADKEKREHATSADA